MGSGRRRNSWIITVAIAAGTVGYLTLLFSPGMRGIAGLRQELRTKQDFVGQAERLRPTTFKLHQDSTAVAKYNEEWAARIIKPAELSRLYGELNGLIKDSGASTARFEPLTPEPYASFRKLPVKLGIEGSFVQLQNVVSRIESLAAFVWIEEIKIEGSQESGRPTKAELTLGMFVDNPKKSD